VSPTRDLSRGDLRVLWGKFPKKSKVNFVSRGQLKLKIFFSRWGGQPRGVGPSKEIKEHYVTRFSAGGTKFLEGEWGGEACGGTVNKSRGGFSCRGGFRLKSKKCFAKINRKQPIEEKKINNNG